MIMHDQTHPAALFAFDVGLRAASSVLLSTKPYVGTRKNDKCSSQVFFFVSATHYTLLHEVHDNPSIVP